jgi:hypothetical protein
MNWEDSPPPQAVGTNVMAILSLIFAFIFWPLGIVFGHVAKHQIAYSGERGEGLATAGLAVGYLLLVFTLCWCGVIVNGGART